MIEAVNVVKRFDGFAALNQFNISHFTFKRRQIKVRNILKHSTSNRSFNNTTL